MVNKCSSIHDELTTVFFRAGSLMKKNRIFLHLVVDLVHKRMIEKLGKKGLKTMRKRCSLADRKL